MFPTPVLGPAPNQGVVLLNLTLLGENGDGVAERAGQLDPPDTGATRHLGQAGSGREPTDDPLPPVRPDLPKPAQNPSQRFVCAGLRQSGVEVRGVIVRGGRYG